MGSYIEMHANKRRGRMDVSDIGQEGLIHWNGPPLPQADKLGEAALDRVFGGRNQWHFISLANNSDSVVTKRLRGVEPSLPFYS